ncbi:unnamed protein product [Periconia digitata]|uniref:Uncharacterized protein n=1 Tax=Periconia digitata TaxID=1303443 RepID=A0A9W4XFZ5_9PLEO|nr:unnamed protein product [Periconia digitata]
MSHSWLQKKRKGELLELAQRASVADADSFLKDDLVAAIEERLDNNESTYAKDPVFVEYYGRAGSPGKRGSSPQEPVVTTTKTRRRTLMKNSASLAADDDRTPDRAALVPRTPRTASQVSRRVSQTEKAIVSPAQRVLERELPLPPSPAQIADVADQSFQVAKTKATELWDKTRLDELKEFIRENASSVSAIQTLILLIEAVGLQYNTLGTWYALHSPAVGTTVHSHEIRLPDVWLLLTSNWWGPATLWSVTSWALPLVFSYFFNLTLRSNTHHRSSARQSSVDPLTFNIVKAILSYSAYHISTQVDAALAGQPNVVVAQTPGWGPFHESSVNVVRNNIPGGYYGLQIGALVGVLVSIYDAALKK